MAMRKKLLSVVALAFAAALSTGVAVTASAETAPETLAGFEVKAVSVRIDENETNKSGIRFQTVTPEAKDAYADAKCYTQLGVEATVSGETKVWKLDVNANVWRTEGENGWNTVLANIPADSYAKEITAQSFIAVSDTESSELPFEKESDKCRSFRRTSNYCSRKYLSACYLFA